MDFFGPKNDENAYADFFTLLGKFKKAKREREILILDDDAIKYCRKRTTFFIDGKVTRKIPVKLERLTFSNSSSVQINYLDKKGNVISSIQRPNKARANLN